MKIILDKEEMRRHLRSMKDKKGFDIGLYYTQRCITKYSHEQQDEFEKELFKTILEVPGGYWQIVENMDYMPVFEKYDRRHLRSYSKGNVPKEMAKRELSEESFKQFIESLKIKSKDL